MRSWLAVALSPLFILSACAVSTEPSGQPADGVTDPRTYYVSAAGNDTNSGTSSSSAWRTISRVNAHDFVPGDKILFRGGDTFAGTLRFEGSDAGTPALPVTVSSYGSGRARINAGTGAGIFVENAGGLIITDLDVVSPDRLKNRSHGIAFHNDLPGNAKLKFIRVSNVNVSGFGKNGLALIGNGRDGTQSGYSDVRFTHVTAWNNTFIGISTKGFYDTQTKLYANSNVYIGYCIVHDNPGQPGFQNHSGNGILMSHVDGGTIEYNLAYNNGALSDYPKGGPVGIWATASNNIELQFNISHSNKSKYADGGGFDFDGGVTNSVMQYNYSYNNDGAGYLIFNYKGSPYRFGSITVRYNISENDGQNPKYGGIIVGGANTAGPINIYNNTIYVSPGPKGPQFGYEHEETADVRFRNNLIIATGGSYLAAAEEAAGSVLQRNVYYAMDGLYRFRWNWRTYDSYSSWRAASGQETLRGADTGLTVDPEVQDPGGGRMLTDPTSLPTVMAYRLRSSSPMIDKALNIQTLSGFSMGTRDFYGVETPRHTHFDIGAAEHP
jgi:hypothetical protein